VELEARIELTIVVVCSVLVAVFTGLAGEKLLAVMFGTTAIWATWELLEMSKDE
jgi:hypothetical protein